MNEEGGEEEEPDNDEEIPAESSEMAPTRNRLRMVGVAKGWKGPKAWGPLMMVGMRILRRLAAA